jgi:hypothetical protein
MRTASSSHADGDLDPEHLAGDIAKALAGVHRVAPQPPEGLGFRQVPIGHQLDLGSINHEPVRPSPLEAPDLPEPRDGQVQSGRQLRDP